MKYYLKKYIGKGEKNTKQARIIQERTKVTEDRDLIRGGQIFKMHIFFCEMWTVMHKALYLEEESLSVTEVSFLSHNQR